MNFVKKAVVSLAFLLVLAYGADTQAASLYIDPAFPSIQMGDSVTLSVRLDTNEAEEECINAVDGVIQYSENLSPVDVSIGDSIFSAWVEQPKIDREKRLITFAGGVPNGYCGRVPGDPRLTNTIVQLIFRSPGFTIGTANGTTTGTVEFLPETTAYLNDGLGTKAELALYGSSIKMGDTPGTTLIDPWREAVSADNIEPAPFSVTVEKIPPETGRYYAIFNTQDKQTGIDQYQVMEEPIAERYSFRWGRADAPWITTRSPYELQDQTLNSTIYVKAIDKAGNEYIATFVPEVALSSTPFENIVLYTMLGLLVMTLGIGLFFVVRILLRKRHKEQRTGDEQPPTETTVKNKRKPKEKKIVSEPNQQ